MLRVVILMQENKTPDFYIPTLASWGANIQNRGKLLARQRRGDHCRTD
jgi:hypothetical protein